MKTKKTLVKFSKLEAGTIFNYHGNPNLHIPSEKWIKITRSDLNPMNLTFNAIRVGDGVCGWCCDFDVITLD